jgi:hypothetical protein
MAKTLTAKALLARHVKRSDRVLLLNPPVEETRYSWVRWNQPLDLLLVGAHLKAEVGCRVELLDFMKPDAAGKVREDWLPGIRRYRTVKGERYPMRRYGQPYDRLTEWAAERRGVDGGWQHPTQVWITSLCSYWHFSVAEVCRRARQTFPEAKLVLLGQYPRLMTRHSADNTIADHVVSEALPLPAVTSALDLYGDDVPPFAALRLAPRTAIAEAKAAVEKGILHFAFFEDDVCRDEGEPLREIVEATKGLHKNLRYHFICGLDPAKVTPAVASILADKKVAEAHFEEADAGEELDVESYRRVRAYLHEAGMRGPDGRLSGFVWIGRPGDRLETLTLRSFQVLDHLGGLILKPFTPTPGGAVAAAHEEYLARVPPDELSPHFFPFAELNGITRGEYHDLYRMAAFLNERVRDKPFDFLRGTLGAGMLRESLRREVWNLGPSPLRLVD